MKLIRYNPDIAKPLPGGSNAFVVPVQAGGEDVTAMMIVFDRKGDTGRRALDNDMLMTVVQGSGQCRSGGSVADLKPGDVAILPGGIHHQIWTKDTQMQIVLLELG